MRANDIDIETTLEVIVFVDFDADQFRDGNMPEMPCHPVELCRNNRS